MSESESDSDDDRVDGAGVEERVTPAARTTPRVACTIGAGAPGAPRAGVGAAGATCDPGGTNDGGGRGGEGGEDGAGAGLRAADAVAAEPPVTEREGYMLMLSRHPANPYANPNPNPKPKPKPINLTKP